MKKRVGSHTFFRTKSILTRAVRPRTRPTDAAMSLLRNADLLACELLTCGALIVDVVPEIQKTVVPTNPPVTPLRP